MAGINKIKKAISNFIKTDKNCWEWQGCLDKDGYGIVTINYRYWRVHRLSYSYYIGPLKKGKIICHRCANKKCFNPEHLYQGTFYDNNNDTVKHGNYKNKYLARNHCENGHIYTKENTYIHNERKRVCKICRRAADKRRYYKKKGIEL